MTSHGQLTGPPHVGEAFVATPYWRRLSPRMLLVHPVREVGRLLPALVLLLVAGTSSGVGAVWGLVGAAVVSVLAVSRYYTTWFRVTGEQVQIREGLVRRRTLAARLDRIRTVDVTSSLLHRALGLARVEIGTGVSDRKGKSSLRLDGLPADQAARLRAELLHRSTAVADAAAAAPTAPQTVPGSAGTPDPPALGGAPELASDEVELARMRAGWIRFAPLTLSGVFTGLALLGFGWRVVSEGQVDVNRVGPVHDVARQLGALPVGVAVLEVLVAVVVFVALASTVGYVLAYWNFRLSRHRAGTFHVSRGLLTTRATSIDVTRMRGVVITEPLPVRLARGARLVAVATGLDVRRNAPAGRSGTVLLPDAPVAEARQVAEAILARPGLAEARLLGHGPAARRRRLTRALGAAGLLVLATWGAWTAASAPDRGWLGALVLLPLAVALATDRGRNLGHLVADGLLVAQSGSLVRRRVLLQTDSIIGWNLRQSFFQRRAGVATLVATTAAGRQSYRLIDVSLPEARRVADEALPGLLAQFQAL